MYAIIYVEIVKKDDVEFRKKETEKFEKICEAKKRLEFLDGLSNISSALIYKYVYGVPIPIEFIPNDFLNEG